jgi:hypothetical protein
MGVSDQRGEADSIHVNTRISNIFEALVDFHSSVDAKKFLEFELHAPLCYVTTRRRQSMTRFTRANNKHQTMSDARRTGTVFLLDLLATCLPMMAPRQKSQLPKKPT